jgi:hypothetical protein
LDVTIESFNDIKPLLELPDLGELYCKTVAKAEATAGIVFPLTLSWPAGKARVQLRFGQLSLSQLECLPRQSCCITTVYNVVIGEDITCGREEHASAMYRTLSLLQQRHIVVYSMQLLGITPLPWDDETADAGYCLGGGLQALLSFAAVGQGGSQQCPLALYNKSELNLQRFALEADDIKGLAAAYGSQLQCLSIWDCIFTKAALVAITADLFPELSSLCVMVVDPQAAADLPPQLIALGLSWPMSRPLTVSVHCETSDLLHGDVLSQHLVCQLQSCREVLQACAAHHISLSWTADKWICST